MPLTLLCCEKIMTKEKELNDQKKNAVESCGQILDYAD